MFYLFLFVISLHFDCQFNVSIYGALVMIPCCFGCDIIPIFQLAHCCLACQCKTGQHIRNMPINSATVISGIQVARILTTTCTCRPENYNNKKSLIIKRVCIWYAIWLPRAFLKFLILRFIYLFMAWSKLNCSVCHYGWKSKLLDKFNEHLCQISTSCRNNVLPPP